MIYVITMYFCYFCWSYFHRICYNTNTNQITTRPGCVLGQICNVNGDPHIGTFGKQRFTYSGTGEHILSKWGSNQITSCLFAAEGKVHSLQRSTSFTCGTTTMLVQASLKSKYHYRKLRVHFMDSKTHSLLSAESTGDFKQCDVFSREVNCNCQNGAHITLNVKAKRFKGNNYVDLLITRKQPEAIAFIETAQVMGGLCQSPIKDKNQVFISGPNTKNNCKSPFIKYPEILMEATRTGHAEMFNHNCGPASWKTQNGPISLIAETHKEKGFVDACAA